ncbi:hypothetical protein JTE90_001374 [Oedothorax gibbosus]|uniref:RNA-directed DNA polymerase n=1 Tax=Oedothorax gibbosus TaxID=931172 RepID=A0AAV6VFD0_9ARAC|nr:hypothetical protein JTE90_001374 [Oedothorax gibbosus]
MVGGGCRTPAEAKVHAVLEFPVPRTKTQVRQFLGLSGYYSRYIKGYATIVEPLTRALKGKNRKEKIEWTEECEKAVKVLKQKLTDRPVLYAPDFTKEFIVQTDASDIGIGVVLAQKGEKDLDHPVLYLSRKFTDAERKCSICGRGPNPEGVSSEPFMLSHIIRNDILSERTYYPRGHIIRSDWLEDRELCD